MLLCLDLVFLRSLRRLLVAVNIVYSTPILVTLITETLRSTETSVLTRTTWRKIPEDGIPNVICLKITVFVEVRAYC
jgi:hypothetical protein